MFFSHILVCYVLSIDMYIIFLPSFSFFLFFFRLKNIFVKWGYLYLILLQNIFHGFLAVNFCTRFFPSFTYDVLLIYTNNFSFVQFSFLLSFACLSILIFVSIALEQILIFFTFFLVMYY